MKLRSLASTCLIWLCSSTINAQSCCAGGGASCCTVGSGSCSILPELDKHIIGLNYSYSLYNTTTYPGMTMNMNGMDMTMLGPGVPTRETMNTVELFGRFNLPKRFQISVSLPVHFLKEQSSEETAMTSGLGDMSVMAFYSFFNPQKFMKKKSKHQLRIGIGIKAPTGKFSMTSDGLFTTDLQLGTGSVDFLFNVNYTYRYRKFGLNVSPFYKKNLANKDRYQFGDNAGGGLNTFFVLNLPNGFTLTPKAGAIYDHMSYNVYNKELLTGTGGEVLKATAGFDIYYKHFVLSTSVAPVLLSISNWVGEPVPMVSFETVLYYSF
jgi:hypothetical protein